MPNGKTHDIISIICLPILVVSLFYIDISTINIIILSISYLFASFMFNGDLDIHSQPYNRWLFLRWIWKPYRSICKHRGLLSHGLFIGTVVRLIYLCTIPLLISMFYGFDITLLFTTETMYIVIGLECGSALHTISDKLF